VRRKGERNRIRGKEQARESGKVLIGEGGLRKKKGTLFSLTTEVRPVLRERD